MGVRSTVDFTRARALVLPASQVGLKAAAELVFRDSDRIVPEESGALRESGKPVVDGQEAAVTYFDPKAVAAHENTRARLKRGKRAKYLETALNSNRQAALALIQQAIRRAL